MTNPAEDNVVQLRPQVVNLEGRVADLDNGYLRIANEIQDALCQLQLAGREWQVLNAIIRLTWGWQKKEDRIQNILIEEKTKLGRNPVSEAVGVLEVRKIIHVRRIGQNRYISINKNVSEWVYTKTRKTIPENRDNYPRKRVAVSPKKGITKDIIPKTIKNNKNTMSEEVRSTDEKSNSEPTKQDPFIEPFEKIFWIAGMRKVGKDKSKVAFKSKFTEWRKETGGSIDDFANFLADDIRCRLRIQQFGFDKMHPATYLNGSRWTDEKPELPQDTAQQPSITVSKNGLVFY